MKYRILTDGKKFYAQVKDFLFWHYIAKYFDTGCRDFPVGSYPRSFKSEKEAEKNVILQHGLSAKRERKIRVI
ncbi:MAG: hypothetical protein PVG65_00555 [Candidatus Thorarchaeota archaeon]|jgi:hypothetical protein